MIAPAHPVIDRLFASLPVTELWLPILFGGDRKYCCDEAAVIEIEGKIVSLATIAPNGEENSGEPTIVGLYTVEPHRELGYGRMVMIEAIERCIERGFQKIRIDVISIQARNLILTLPKHLLDRVDIHLVSQLIETLELVLGKSATGGGSGL